MVTKPVTLLYDCEGLIVTIDTSTATITGTLTALDDTLNVTVTDAIFVDLNGEKTKVDRMVIKGSTIRWISLPPIMEHAPMLKD